MSVRDIQACLLEMYQVDVSEGLISQATEGIMQEVSSVNYNFLSTTIISSLQL
jgi:transposase-like protein